jgi:hypothetical protein
MSHYFLDSSALLQAADLPELTTVQRWMRLQFRRPKTAAPAVTAQTADDPYTFPPHEEGGGLFGRWTLDEAGLPAYEYTFDHLGDPRAAYPNSENRDRRDHWHQVGNRRVTALASNDGTVQVYLGDRGGVFLNRFEAWDDGAIRHTLLSWLFGLLLRFVHWLSRINKGRTSPVQPLTARPESKAVPSAQSIPYEVERGQGDKLPPRGALPPNLAAARSQKASGISAQAVAPANNTIQSSNYAYAGGFGYINDGAETWATAYRYAPAQAKHRRIFGMGYVESEILYRDLRVTRRTYAPPGDIPALLADVSIENRGSAPANLSYYEYWDVNVQQLRLEWLRGGNFAAASDAARRALNQGFSARVTQEGDALRCRQAVVSPQPSEYAPPEDPCEIDWSPADIFLVDLAGSPDAVFTDDAAFFGAGGARQPDAIVRPAKPVSPGAPAASAQEAISGKRYCMVMRREVRLAPGESRTLRYAFGAVRPDGALDFLDAYRAGEPFRETQSSWKEDIAYFSTGEDPVLQRETAWHSYNLLSAVVYNAFHGVHLVPQGSAYLYLHGADGAPRDQALFTLPMTYLNPELARDMLRLIMRLTDGQTGQITYAFAGYGVCSDALGVHNKPSDLDLFFLLALAEYLAATGDRAFLDEEVPFYPPKQPPTFSDGLTVLHHVRAAIRHLFEGTGVGEHGLLKVGSGDWSDAVVLENALRDGPGPFGVTYENSKANGESVPNTQMAIYVLPLIAALVRDDALDIYLAGRVDKLRDALRPQWNPRGYYNRAVLRGVTNNPITISDFELEAQPWAVISGAAAAEPGCQETLIQNVNAVLDVPSPVGALLKSGGMVWPAVSQLLTWAYAKAGRGDLAWRSLNRHTFAAHAHYFPAVWFNIWTGPDGVNGPTADPPGGTWATPMTPMTDFPAMNANQDAMALLGLLRVCGVEPAPGGLLMRPVVPRERWTLDTPLLLLRREPGRIFGEYRAHNDGEITLYIATPQNETQAVYLRFQAGQRVPFEVTW